MDKGQVLFVSGIDTDIGKSYATAWLAHTFITEGMEVTTQKPIQTGCENESDDLCLHDNILATLGHTVDPSLEQKRKPHRCSYLFSFPASPHLSASQENATIDIKKIDRDTKALMEEHCDMLLIEGAGGLMVPITKEYLTIDFIADRNYPLCLVTSGRLGSLNHTLLSLEAIEKRNIPLFALLYNQYSQTDPIIDAETREYLHRYIADKWPDAGWVDVPDLSTSL